MWITLPHGRLANVRSRWEQLNGQGLGNASLRVQASLPISVVVDSLSAAGSPYRSDAPAEHTRSGTNRGTGSPKGNRMPPTTASIVGPQMLSLLEKIWNSPLNGTDAFVNISRMISPACSCIRSLLYHGRFPHAGLVTNHRQTAFNIRLPLASGLAAVAHSHLQRVSRSRHHSFLSYQTLWIERVALHAVAPHYGVIVR